jgi:hypothetical protein
MVGRLRLHVYVAGTAVLATGFVVWALPHVSLLPVLAVVSRRHGRGALRHGDA